MKVATESFPTASSGSVAAGRAAEGGVDARQVMRRKMAGSIQLDAMVALPSYGYILAFLLFLLAVLYIAFPQPPPAKALTEAEERDKVRAARLRRQAQIDSAPASASPTAASPARSEPAELAPPPPPQQPSELPLAAELRALEAHTAATVERHSSSAASAQAPQPLHASQQPLLDTPLEAEVRSVRAHTAATVERNSSAVSSPPPPPPPPPQPQPLPQPLPHPTPALSEAEALRAELASCRAAKGARHRDTLMCTNALALRLADLHQLAEAEELYREALTGLRAALGATSPSTITLMSNLAALLRARGKQEESVALLREVVEAKRASMGPRHPSTQQSEKALEAAQQEQPQEPLQEGQGQPASPAQGGSDAAAQGSAQEDAKVNRFVVEKYGGALPAHVSAHTMELRRRQQQESEK